MPTNGELIEILSRFDKDAEIAIIAYGESSQSKEEFEIEVRFDSQINLIELHCE